MAFCQAARRLERKAQRRQPRGNKGEEGNYLTCLFDVDLALRRRGGGIKSATTYVGGRMRVQVRSNEGCRDFRRPVSEAAAACGVGGSSL
jgi:hypothetical protein